MAVEISNDVYTSLKKYFCTLTHLGYKPYNEVEKLLILCFIEELLTGDMAFFITEEDYNNIDKALNCIYGSCMISYPNYKKAVDKPVRKVYEQYRVTESNILRETEDNFLRVMS